MKKLLSIMVSGTVIAVCAGGASAVEPSPGSDIMNKIETQQEKAASQEKQATDVIKEKEKAADKAKESAKKKKKKLKEIQEGKEKPAEKMMKATEEGEQGAQEMKEMKKEYK